LFYGWWDWRFLILIAFTTVISWYSGLIINKFHPDSSNNKTKQWSKIVSITNIVINLSILGVFKYYNFFAESFKIAFESIGIILDARTLDVILPVGISFYTFQALSYSIDVYRRKINTTSDIVSYFAYVSFFPQLVAGPIERATNLLPQFQKQRIFEYNMAVDGMRQILWGLFKKIVVADNCAIYVNQVFENGDTYSGSTLLLAAVLFAFQIYGDFSGYSDIAIGTARLFGINLMRNFAFPYFSRDIAEFWRRWHISLSTWFRDYVYIPLGGSRAGKLISLRNTMIIFVVSGFWHGANWTFVAWGFFHALLFLPLLLINKNRMFTDIVADGKLLPTFREFFQILSTFVLVVVGWVFFRAESISESIDFLLRIPNALLFHPPVYIVGLSKTIFFIILLVAIEWFQRHKQHGLDIRFIGNKYYRWAIYLIFIGIVAEFGAASQSFIYFQF
jgi:D-alanyl-lipoteichoic acid acyltransferase DltB (MBOAT superfamily)